MVEFIKETSLVFPGAFLFENLFIFYSISLAGMCLLIVSVSLYISLVDYVFQRTSLFDLVYQICGVVFSILLLSFSGQCDQNGLFFHFIIGDLSLLYFFLINLARELSITLIFAMNLFWFHWFFSLCFKFSLYFCWFIFKVLLYFFLSYFRLKLLFFTSSKM